jgi:S-DNA-T family DNA segregation ATPase FtsK/SpoIIIE
MFDRVFLGLDEDGHRVEPELVYRNMLIGGEPGGGKSVALNNVVAHAAMAPDCRLWLFDGKQVELGLWAEVAEGGSGPTGALARAPGQASGCLRPGADARAPQGRAAGAAVG